MLFALLIVQAAVGQTVATCRVPDDPLRREWRLERRDTRALSQEWRVLFRGRMLDQPVVELRLPGATPVIVPGDVRLSYASSQSAELVVGAGAAWSVKLFQSAANRRYAVQVVSWGRELTRAFGPGMLRGRFVWAAEVTPIFAQTAPAWVYGFGVAPVVWRWNFEPRPRWSAFGELSMGGLWTAAPIPEETSRANFTAHWGGGVRLFESAGRSLMLGYRFQHISNGNNLGSNPGVNSHVMLAGVSVRRRH